MPVIFLDSHNSDRRSWISCLARSLVCHLYTPNIFVRARKNGQNPLRHEVWNLVWNLVTFRVDLRKTLQILRESI